MNYYVCNGYIYEYSGNYCKRRRADIDPKLCGRVTSVFAKNPYTPKRKLSHSETALKLEVLFNKQLRATVDADSFSSCVFTSTLFSPFCRIVVYNGKMYFPMTKYEIPQTDVNVVSCVDKFAMSIGKEIVYDWVVNMSGGEVKICFDDFESDEQSVPIIKQPVVFLHDHGDVAVIPSSLDTSIRRLLKTILESN